MHTISRLDDSETLTEGQLAGVEAFLETLRDEQAHFLAAVRHASSLLSREAGQLAHVAAIQSRLTQQFFDAQRLIMTRRAEFDAEVELIRRSAAPDSFDPNVRSARHEIAALGVAVIRTKAEADDLACVIDDAFSPDEPDGAAPQRQLALMLDEWWAAENREGQAVIELARARAEMQGHVARIEADEVIARALGTGSTGDVVTDDEQAQALPPNVCALLDEADPENLEGLLALLAESLNCRTVALEPSTIDLAPIAVEQPDTTDDFWTGLASGAVSRRIVRWSWGSNPHESRQGRHDRR